MTCVGVAFVVLQAKCRDFESMLWFESLLFYGCEEREQERGDVDVALLPTVVEKVLLPKLTGGFRAEHSGTWAPRACFRGP